MSHDFIPAELAASMSSLGCDPALSQAFFPKAHEALNSKRPPPSRRTVEMSKMHALYLSPDLGGMLQQLYKLAVASGDLQPHEKPQDLVRRLIYACGVAVAKRKRFVIPT